MMVHLTCAMRMDGYDHNMINPLIKRNFFRKAIYDESTYDDCIKMLLRAHDLALGRHTLEKLELYILDRIDKTEVHMNEHRVKIYLLAVNSRRHLSQVQIQCAIRFIDKYFDIARI